jgi:predicted Zn-dependent peptidase
MIPWTVPVLAAALSAALPAQVAQTFRLDTGLNCVLLESHDLPLIRMELVTRWDRSELPAGKEALAGFLADAMRAGGAGGASRNNFNRALDALGMRFAFRSRMGSYRWTLVADSRAQETAMELLVDAVVRPAFDGPLVETGRQALIKRAGLETPRTRGVSRFLWSVGAPEALLPPAGASLDRIEFQDLLDFKRRVIRPEGSTLLLYGDLNLTQAKQLALMHLGIWQPSVQAPLKGLPPRAADKPAPRLLAVLEPSPATELWAGAPRPLASAPAVDALLPILLARWSRRQFGSLGMTFTLAQDARTPLLIKARVPSAERDGLVPGFMAALASLRRGGLSEQDLAFAVVQWKAENAALALHPEPLLRDLADGRLDPGLAQAVNRLTLTEVSQALQSWLDPDRLRYLLLGADAPMLQAAEKAGLAPSMVMGD